MDPDGARNDHIPESDIDLQGDSRVAKAAPDTDTHAFVFSIFRDSNGRHRLRIERHAVRLDIHSAGIFHGGDDHFEAVVDSPQKIDVLGGT
jgi:hypothetical protein